MWLGPRPMCVRRCPTLPHPPGCSTISAVGLSFRVRNGTGRFPHAMTAVTLCPHPGWPRFGGFFPGGKFLGYNSALVGAVWCCYSVLFWFAIQQGMLFGNHIVDASSLVSFYPTPWVQTLLKARLRGGCVV